MTSRIYQNFDLDLQMKKDEGKEVRTDALTWFCVHEPGSGADPSWLFRALGDEEATATALEFEASKTVEESAAALLDKVKGTSGRIALGGIGVGGAVALELALRLRDDGADVDALVCLNAPAPGSLADGSSNKVMSLRRRDREKWSSMLEEERKLRGALEAYQPSGDCGGITLHLITTNDGHGSMREGRKDGEAWQGCGFAASDILLYASDGGREAAGAIQRILAAQRHGGKSFGG